MRYLPLLPLLFSACGLLKGQPEITPGKIVTKERETWRLYGDDFERKPIRFLANNGIEPSAVTWMYRQNKVVGTVMLKKGSRYFHSEVDLFDINGKLNSILYRTDSTEVLGDALVSWDDSKAVFLSWKIETPYLKNGRLPDKRLQSIGVLGVETKGVIDRINDIGMISFFNESPWVYGSEQFIYTTIVESKSSENKKDFTSPVYLYDLPSKTSQLIIPNGNWAVCSPREKKVAYTIERGLWTFDIEKKESKKLYESPGDIVNVHWVPGGNKIRLEILGPLLRDRSIYVDAQTGTESNAETTPEMKIFSWK